ncbi:MAG: arginine--tRNA ligase [Firmicutes bacterium]|jgi:arginyl-tRNA synthetase|nr:arginine--tRNA ligase [Bacillota bacterium]
MDFKIEIAKLLDSKIESLNQEEIFGLIEYPKNTEMGDFAFPCFRLAKEYRKAPPMIAGELVEAIGQVEMLESVEAVGGYLNFKINKEVFARTVLEGVLDMGDDYGKQTVGENKKVIVEFSSTNIAKPFHIGHIRSTMIGNSLNRIYKMLGYDTVAINHLGDYGTQFGKLIVAYKLWGSREAIEKNPIPELLKIYVKFHEEAEEKPELEDEARAWFTKLENDDKEAYELWSWFREVSLKEFNRVYSLLGVEFDSYDGESFYSDKMGAVLEDMRNKNVMEVSEGAEIVNLEEYDMTPALITKKDGSSLYITRDLAAAIYRKNNYEFFKNIYVVGSQQKLHFSQLFKILELMGYAWSEDCTHVDFGMVSLAEGTMSTRKGRVVFLEEVLLKAIEEIKKVIDEKNPNLEGKEDVARQVGVGAVVFQELFNNRIKDYTFSWEKALSFEGETGPYVQYTHARACSVLRKADLDYKNEIDFSKLDDKASMDLLRELAKFPKIIQDAGNKNEPSIITRYVVGIAQLFNRFYHDNPILTDDKELTKARLSLVYASKVTIKNGLYLVSIEAPERM